jgi:RNA polymerase-binding transcription factor DksA
MATTKKTTKTSPSVRKAAAATGARKAAVTAATKSANAAKRPAAKQATGPAKAPAKAPAKKAPAKRTAPAEAPAAVDGGDHDLVPPPRGHTKDGIAYTKDFDAKFLKSQRDLLAAERQSLLGQADRLEDEANSLIEDGEMGDVQFDDESGEGDTMVVERERDLALSAQARQTVADIDAALDRLTRGTYGYSLVSGRPIPRERLEAIPWATELVEEKVGGIGRR